MKRYLIIIGIAIAAFIIIAYFYLNTSHSYPFKSKIITIKEGTSFSQATNILYKEKLISQPKLFILGAKIKGITNKIKAGEYEIKSPISVNGIYNILISGKSITYSVTIPEGYNIFEIAQALIQAEIIKDKNKFLNQCFNVNLIKSLKIRNVSVEGYLYPETYKFTKGVSAQDIIKAMVSEFFTRIDPTYLKRAKQMGFTLNKLVTLASIIEKETSVPIERPLISSVFQNRLRINMRLENDPTIIYGILSKTRGEFDGNIRRKDIRAYTPYNTYVIRGIPPGPIASPSIDAIHATLYPEKTKYLYFVSRNDGTHKFSRTYKEHAKAVRLYQLRRKK